MQAVSYINNIGDCYTIEPIKDFAYIDMDASHALDLAKGSIDAEEYKDAIRDCVEQGLAFSIYKNKERVGYVYNRIVDYKYNGASINIQDTGAMILGLKTMFEICDLPRIYINPTENNLGKFVSMLNGKSLRVWHNTKEAAYVNKEDIVPKGEKAYRYLGFKEV